MDSIIKSFWFWLLIIGVLLILTAILIAGGIKQMHGWTWGLFVVGCVLAILGIIFGFIAWYRYKPCPVEEEETCPKVIDGCGCEAESEYVTTPVSSRIGTPTVVTTNIPQAKRGFATTSLTLDNLAPEK